MKIGIGIGKKILPVYLLLMVISVSCADHYCDSLTDALKSQCKGSSKCDVTFKETFRFEWDSLYMFDSMLYPDEVSKALGFDCKCDIVPEGKRLVVFTKGGKAVQKYLTECYSVNFVKMRVDGITVIERNSVFALEKRLVNGETQYYLMKKVPSN